MLTNLARAMCDGEGIVQQSYDSRTVIVRRPRAIVHFSSCYAATILRYAFQCRNTIVRHAYDVNISGNSRATEKIFRTCSKYSTTGLRRVFVVRR